MYLTLNLKVMPFECGDEIRRQKTRIMWLPYGEGRTMWAQSTRLTDGQTDGQICDNYKTVLCVASRCKKTAVAGQERCLTYTCIGDVNFSLWPLVMDWKYQTPSYPRHYCKVKWSLLQWRQGRIRIKIYNYNYFNHWVRRNTELTPCRICSQPPKAHPIWNTPNFQPE